MLILPGGLPGAANLAADERVIDLVKYFNKQNKFIVAICAAPTVLAKAGIIDGRIITAYSGYETKLLGCHFVENNVVIDNNIITSRGLATPYPFAYKIAEILRKDTTELRERMLIIWLEENKGTNERMSENESN
ncbi:hypothetical protein CFB3_26400 [Clostridium folliculivorans]|uniref:DJ-1/PfpI domain-containing protein n=2 Tax=Clostridium folliculivorans TaxID=2886038 RepID=A0A9W5Y0S4_9CLOT|nr:hypothetical protein CFOLD11_12650 [Clostridium folliculivorans]GKU30533.1 hypothetical protein CFB3_26400 [Clostridium folliculivorans]